jgi:hypothetical protein
MAATKQVLRLQSDQTLDDPQIATRVRLLDLAATRAINLIWVEPAVTDRDITFKDPTANDAVVYENLAQTLSNKTLPTPTITDFTNAQHDHSSPAEGGAVDHNGLSSLTVGDVHTQYGILAGRAGGQVLIGGSAANEDLSLQSTSDVTRGEIVAIDDILMGSGKEVLGLPVTPSGPTAAASKAYVDVAVSGGASWKETLLSANQLDSVNNAVSNGGAFYLVNTAQIGDTFVLSDGGTTETWTFAGGSGAFAPAIGASALDSMTDLAARINTDSTAWAAIFYASTLQGINSGTGDVVIVYRQVPTAVTADRLYGVFATPADAQFVDFGGDTDYRDGTSIQVVPADPTTANFGLGRITSALQPNDTHLVRAEDSAFVWNEDAGTWQLSAGAVSLATSGPGGLVVGQSTFDEDFGLEVVGGGIARVRVDTSSITFDGGGQLTIAGGAIAFSTSGSGGAVAGKVTMDSDKGLLITGGPTNAIAEVRVDTTSIAFNVSGELTATGAPISPTGLVSHGVLTTRDILGVTAPTAGFISADVPVQDYVDVITTGQLFDFVVPADYDGGDMELLASYQMTTAVAQDIVLETTAKIIRSSTGTVDTVTFPAATANLVVPATTDLTRSVIKVLVNPGEINFLPGDTIQFYVKRLGGDGADLHTGSWRVTAFQFRYTGQVSTRLMEPVVDIFTPVSGSASPSNDFFATDIPVITYSDLTDQAASARFVVPDNWDGNSDALLRLQYGLDTASGGTVRLNTSGNIADVGGGAVIPISSVDFDVTVTADIDPHRTSIIRSIPASLMTPGSVIQIAITRDISVGGNAAAGYSAINATLAFGVVPIAGFASITDFYLDDPVFGNIAGTVDARPVYPLFASDFEYFFEMSSTAAAGAVHGAFVGRLAPVQTEISQICIFVKGVDTGTVTYDIKVYAEGSGAVPVFSTGAATPPASSTEIGILGTALSAQPTGDKRFFVVIEAAAMENGESVSFSKPFVQVQ